MAKQSGLGSAFYLDGYDLSGDVTALGEIGGGPAALRGPTGIDKAAFETLGGVRDGRMNVASWFNPSAGQQHDRFGNLPVADVIAEFRAGGTALGGPVATINAKQVDYNGTRATDGSLTWSTSLLGNAYGLEWCVGLTAGKRTDGSATNGTGVDFAAASSFGLQAYLQVFAFTGTSVTVKLQESSDNGVGDAWVDVTGGGFTAATGITRQRIETTRALAVERYLRVVTTGTFSNAVFAVSVAKNAVSTVF